MPFCAKKKSSHLNYYPRLMSMARFRNLIVHDYARIDDRVVFDILKQRLGDLTDYVQAIALYLEAE